MKRNSYLDRIQQAEDERCRSLIHITEGMWRQLMFDIMTLSMRENRISFDKISAVIDTANKELTEFCDDWQAELCSRDDPDKKIYTREKLQGKLERAFPGKCISWEERYKGFEQAWELCWVSKSKLQK